MIRIVLVITVALVLGIPAFAQQPAQQSPSQIALQIDAVINGWAQALEAQERALAELRQQLVAANARVKALEDKYESKKEEKK